MLYFFYSDNSYSMVDTLHALIRSAVPENVHFSLTPSERAEFGHYSSNIALVLSKQLGKNPRVVAEELLAKIKTADTAGFIANIEIAGPGFLNFWFSEKALDNAFRNVLKAGKKWGSQRINKKRPTVVIDYSHPNIAKPMSVAHLRSTIIGASLVNIFKFLGWKTIGDNHLGDWGKQFGILIAAIKGQRQTINDKQSTKKKISIQDLMKLYVDYTARMKEDAALEDVARAETKKLQDGDRENTALWKQFYKISLREFKKFYTRLGIKFDYYLGESFYKEMLPGIVAGALEKGIAEKSEGAVIIPIEGLSPFVIQKSDEAFLYSTTDIAAVQYRRERFKPDLVLYVVDNGQSLHFEQLFKVVEKLDYKGEMQLQHVKFGLVLGEDMKKLSTRAGKHISLGEVLDEAVVRAKALVDEKRTDLSERERRKIAEAVGIAAVKYNDLSQNRQSDIAFQWDKMLNFEGNSAPYLLYSYARMRSILRKGRFTRGGGKTLAGPHDRALFLKLVEFPNVLRRVEETFFPNLLTDYLFELSKATNAFYEQEPVLKAEPAVRASRLLLVRAVSETLKTGLGLLGIKALERM